MANEIDPFAYNPEFDILFGGQKPTDIEEPDLSQYLPQEPPTRGRSKAAKTSAVNRNLSPEARALLDTVAGDESPDYNTIYGGRKVSDLSRHPGIDVPIGRGPNAGKTSSAAGRYQFLKGTWNEQAQKLGLQDFSPENQDLAAWNLANETYGNKTGRDLQSDLSSNNPALQARIGHVLSGTWTSLPGGIEQGAHANSFVDRYRRSLSGDTPTGTYAPTGSYGEPDISQDPEFLQQFQQQENPLAGTYAIPLSNGQMLHAPEGMDRNEALAHARSMGVEAEGLKDIHLANGQILHAPDSMDEAEAIAQAKALKPDMDFTTKAQAEHAAKQGMGPAAVSGFKGAVGQLATGAGEWTEDANILKQPSDWLKKQGAELSKKAAEEYAPLTKEEAAAQGPLGYAKKYFAEPLAQGAAGIVPLAGAYAVPGIGPVLGTAALATQETGALAQEAQQEGREFTKAGALPTIAGATALNYLGIKHLGPLRKAFGEEFSAGERAAVKAAINEGGFEAAQKVVGSKLGNIAKNVGISSGAFASGDVGTRVLERIYADKPVADDDAFKEYGDILTQDLPLGVVAGAGRGYMAHGAKAAALDKSGAEMRAAAPRPMPGEETVAEAPELTATAEPEHTPETADILAKARAAEQAQQEAPITEVPEPKLRTEHIESEGIAPPVEEPKVPFVEEPVAPPVEEPHFSESILGLKPHSGLAKKLKGLDINNLEDHSQIDEILSKTRVDIPAKNLNALEARMDAVKPPEVTSAEQIPETGAPDGSGGPQPSVRKKGRDQTIPSEGVEPSRQGEQAPEVKVPEEKVTLPNLPTELSRAKENFGYGPKKFSLSFDNDIDRAAYIARNAEKPSKRDQDYLQFVMDNTGMSEAEVRKHGTEVHKAIKDIAKDANSGPLKVPSVYDKADEWATTKPPKAPEVKVPEEKVDRPDYWRDNPNAPEDATTWQDIFGALHHDTDHTLPSGTKIVGVVSSEQGGTIDLRMKTPQGGKKFWSLSPDNRAQMYWKSFIGGEPVTEKALRKNFGDALYEKLYALEGTPVKSYEAFNKVAEGVVDAVRNTAPSVKAPEKALKKAPLKAHEVEEAPLTTPKPKRVRAPAPKVVPEGVKAPEVTAAHEMFEDARDLAETHPKEVDADLLAAEEDRARMAREGFKPEDYDEDSYLYGKAKPTENAHTPDTLRVALSEKYGKNAPKLEVSTREAEQVGPDVKGFHDPKTGRTVLIADNIGKGEDLHGLVRHEVAVHARRMGKTEPEFQHMLNRLQELKASGAKDVVKAYESVPKDTKPEHVHEEALAYLVHKAPHLPLVKRFMSWLRRAAHKVTGDHAWLKSDDFGKMADAVLKRRVEAPTRGATAERMYAKEPSATEQALRDLKVHATGKEKSSKERVDSHIENTQRTHNKWEEWYNRHIRQPFVAKDSFLSMVLKNEADFDTEGKASANVKRAQASQTAQIINNANKMGHVVHDPQSGLVKIEQSDLNPEALRKRAQEETDPEAFGAAMSIMAMRGHQKRHEAAGKAIEAFDADRKLLDKFVKSLPEESPDRTAANKAAAELRVKIASLKKRYDAIEDKGGMHPDITPEKVSLADRYFKENEAAGKLRDDYLQMFRNDAKLLRDTGVISNAAHKEFTKEEYHYVPLYKTLEDLETDIPKVEILSGGPSAIKGPKKKGVGGHEINFYENVITHQIRMVSAAIENNARLSTLKSLEGLGEAKEMHQGWTPSQNPNAMVVRVNDKGVQKTYVVDDKAVYEAFQIIRQLPIPDFITNFTKEFSRFALMNPAYWWRQLVREPFMANFTARTGIITPYHTIKEFGSLLLGDMGLNTTAKKLYDQMRSQGITGSHEYLRNAQITHGKIFEDKNRLTAAKDAVGSGISKWARWHELADAATKVAVMKKALKQAQREGYTGEQAKDVAIHKVRDMINFANMGNAKSVRVLNQTIPFFNSWVQGLDALVRNATGLNMTKAQAAQARKLFWGRAMTMVAASMAYSYIMASTSKAYQDANEEDVYNNWLIPVPEELGLGKSRMLKMAAPFEIGAVFKALPEFFMRRFMGLDKDKEFKDVAANQFWKNIAPPGLESAFIPQILKPIIESTAGKTVSIRGKGIPIGNQFIAPELRGRGDSPLADSIADVTGLSPAVANNMMRGYFAEVYSGMDAIAKGVQSAMGSPTARADLRDMTEKVPFAKGFLTNPNKLDQTSAYDFMNEVKTAKASATYAAKRGMPEAREYAKKGAASGVVANMEATLSTLNAAIENLKNKPNNPALIARRDKLLESKKKVLENIERMKIRLDK